MKIPKKLRTLPFSDTWKGNHLIQWQVRVTQPAINGERFLCVDFICNEAYKKERHWMADPETFRVICSKKQSDYRIYAPKENKLKTASTLSEMIRRVNSPTVVYISISEREEAILRRWTGRDSRNHQMETLCDWCDEAREKTRHAKRAARGEIEDEDYILCPKGLPDGFEQWVRREVISDDYTLVYKKGNVRGLCYACGQKVRAMRERFRQGATVNCPNCGARVYSVLENGARFSSSYVQNVAALQMGTDGKTLFVREWHLCRDPKAEYKDITEFLDEFQRFAIRGDKVAKWLKESKENYFFYHQRYALSEWTRTKGTEVYDGSYRFYTDNVRVETQNCKLRYANIDGYICTTYDTREYKNVIRFMLDFARYPLLEFLQKGGYYKLIAEWIRGFSKEDRPLINKSGKTLKACFKKMPLHYLKILPADQWGVKQIRAAQWLTKYPERLNEEYTRIFLEELPLTDRIGNCLEYMSLKQLLKYLTKQERSGTRIADIAYSDYIKECEMLELDLTSKEVLFPSNLHVAHQRTSAQIEYKANETKIAAFSAAAKKLDKLSYQSGELLIRPAQHPNELTNEGKTLHHCVGGYVDKMASGSTAIFFIRLINYPDNPYYTLELKDKKVQQCYTLGDRTCQAVGEPFIQTFVDEWMSKVVLKEKKTKTA